MMEWTAIVLTCQNSNYTSAYQKELDKRQSKGFLNKDTILLVVEDPKSQIGSGGATLNALLVLAEHISAKRGFLVINQDVLENSRILLIHSGRIMPFEPCGRPFITLPLIRRDERQTQLNTLCLLDLIIDLMSNKVAVDSSPGVWVCSSDMLLIMHEKIDSKCFVGTDACLLMVSSSLEYSRQHGVCELDEMGEYLQNIHYKCKEDDILCKCKLSSGLVPLVSGIVYLSLSVVNTLLTLHTISPLDACTYLGCDSGIATIQLSLFFDFLLAMCPGYTEENFIKGGIYAAGRERHEDGGGSNDFMSFARKVVYKHFSAYKCKTLLVNGNHTYLTQSGQDYLKQIIPSLSSSISLSSSSSSFSSSSSSSSSCCMDPSWEVELRRHYNIKDGGIVGDGVGLLNCSLIGGIEIGSGSLLQNVSIRGNDVHIGRGCIVSSIIMRDVSKFHLNNNLSMVGFLLGHNKIKRRVVVTLGCHDNIMDVSTFCNTPFQDVMKKMCLRDEDLWNGVEIKSLYNAKLFPTLPHCMDGGDGGCYGDDGCYGNGGCYGDDGFIGFVELFQTHEKDSTMLKRWKNSQRVSLEDIFNGLDVEGQVELKRSVFHQVSCGIINEVLVDNQSLDLQGLYKEACLDGRGLKLLEELDRIGCDNHQCPGISARVLANIANLLGEMSGGEGGLRSGPASNHHWMESFKLLEKKDVIGGLRMMSQLRMEWVDTSSRMVRAARHYEGACQILIRQAVMTVHKFIKTKSCDLLEINQWVTCNCPARIDISGGWSDTPPLTYESGGAVFNAAITVNGLKPIGAQARRIPELLLVIHLEGGMRIIGSDLDFMRNHNQPSAAGSLLKACLICSGLVEYPSETSLFDQLQHKYKSGFEIKSWSNLPHGSGLGTSSIMAGAVLACLWKVAGRSFDIHSLNHAVLYVEQLLTTGGGWQDQVGGLTAGVKLGHSRSRLPLEIEVDHVTTSKEIMQSFNNRLVLIYTGQTRLAKNLLQNVIRNWYARDEEVIKIIKELVNLAHRSKESFQKGDLVQLGKCMTKYWQLKKTLAPGSEPRAVTLMMDALKDSCHGICMAGAGGGGFMYLLTKREHDEHNLREILDGLKNENHPEVYEACVDADGMTLQVEGQTIEKIPFKM